MQYFLFAVVLLISGIRPALSLCRNRRRAHPNCRLLPDAEECGVVTTTQRVVGGHEANLGQFPWIAILHYPGPTSSGRVFLACGGSVINDRYLISAAHCLFFASELQRERLRIRLGEYNLSSALDCSPSGDGECAPTAKDFEVENIILHPEYDPRSLAYDIGLIRLKEKIDFNRYISPICLPTDRRFKSENALIGKTLELAGWGVYNQEGGVNLYPDTLQTVSIPYISRRQCALAYGRRMSDSKLCAGAQRGKDACMGDSGGPLVGMFSPKRSRTRYFLVGVVSWGPGEPCGALDVPGVYINLPELIGWVLDNITN